MSEHSILSRPWRHILQWLAPEYQDTILPLQISGNPHQSGFNPPENVLQEGDSTALQFSNELNIN